MIKSSSASEFFSKTKTRHSTPVIVDSVCYDIPNGTKSSSSPNSSENIRLLDNVSTVFENGSMSAIMGPSGAGKTTLLDILSCRKTRGVISGTVMFGSQNATKKTFKECAAYVEQFDTLLPMLTVEETLYYWSEMQARTHADAELKKERVREILQHLNLTSCKDVVVGDALNRGISGGQAKRTNIALALVTDPDVLFLDEPTSGLDSQSSVEVVEILRNLANTGVTVVATIHSPTPDAFRYFDTLCMLKNGKMTFTGPIFDETAGGKYSAISYFASIGFKWDTKSNLADFLTTTCASEDLDFEDAFRNSECGKAALTKTKSILEKEMLLPAKPKLAKAERGAFAKIKTLLKYRTIRNYKSVDFVMSRAAGQILFAIVQFTLFLEIGKAEGEAMDQANQLNVASLLYMLNILPSFGASGYMPSIVLERAVFYREVDDGSYPLFSYVAYKFIEEGVLAIPVTLVAHTALYLGCALQGSFAIFWICNYMVLSCGIALAYVCASVAPNMDAANTLLPVYNVIQLLFSGMLIRRADMPSGWEWYSHTLFVRYGWQAQMINYFDNKEPKVFQTKEGKMEGIIEFYGASGTITSNLIAVFGLYWFWIIVAYVCMKNIRHQSR